MGYCVGYMDIKGLKPHTLSSKPWNQHMSPTWILRFVEYIYNHPTPWRCDRSYLYLKPNKMWIRRTVENNQYSKAPLSSWFLYSFGGWSFSRKRWLGCRHGRYCEHGKKGGVIPGRCVPPRMDWRSIQLEIWKPLLNLRINCKELHLVGLFEVLKQLICQTFPFGQN